MKKHCVLVLTAALAIGCGSDGSDGDGDDDEQEGEPPAQPEANPLGGLGMMGALMSGGSDEPGRYEAPRTSPGFDDDDAHAVVLELSGPIVEMRSFSFLGGFDGLELRTVTDRLDALAAEENVTGLLVRFGRLDLTPAAAEELRAALLRFEGEGEASRRIVCHTEAASNLTYLVMTACDDIGLAPAGELVVSGAAAMPIHVKELLDDLGVEPDFLHVGDFKGAAEPITREKPSPEMIETLEAILDQSFRTLVAGVAEGRDLEPARVRALIDRAVFQGQDAADVGLVDRIAVFERYRDVALEETPWQVRRFQDSGARDMSGLMQFLGMAPRSVPAEPHVALVRAVGNIVDGEGGGVTGASSEIASRPLSAALRALARDESVAAIVLRIDSPGGSALASDVIWHAVREARDAVPVVVSMGGTAASGGYYIASAADVIYASRNTLTGSIGVVGGKIAVGKALEAHGVKTYPLGRGKRALMGSTFERWSDDERRAVRDSMQGVYDTFIARVAEGRDMDESAVRAVAQGRVWTGAAAHERGLVDELGGLDAAMAEARRRAELAADAPFEVYPPKPTLEDLLEGFGQVRAPLGLESAVGAVADALAPAEARVLERLVAQLLSFQDTRVQTTALLPIVVR